MAQPAAKVDYLKSAKAELDDLARGKPGTPYTDLDAHPYYVIMYSLIAIADELKETNRLLHAISSKP